MIALALTPTIAATTESSRYQAIVQEIAYGTPIDPSVANTTTTLYNIRNVTTLYNAELKDVADNSSIVLVSGTNFTCTGAKTFTYTGLNNTKTYWGTIYYETVDLTSAAILGLIAVLPILWVIIVLAFGVVAIKIQLGEIA